MAKHERKGRFSGVAAKSLEKQTSHSGFGYLNKDGLNMYEPTPGETEFLNFLPYIVKSKNHPDAELGAKKGEQWFKFPFQTHKNVGSGNGDTVVCLQTWGERCPICEYRAKRAKEGASKDELSELNVSKRALYVVIPVADPEARKKKKKKGDDEIHIMDISNFCFSNQLVAELKEKPEFEDFADLEYGNTVRIRWSEEEFNKNKFAKAGRIDFLDREVIDESILEEIPDLGRLLKKMEYEELKAKFFEMDDVDDDDEDDDDDDEPRNKKKPAPKKSSKKVDDDDDEEDDEEDEKPKRKPLPKPSAKKPSRKDEDDDDDDDDEDDDDEDDDDEDEKPKKKSPSKPMSKKSSKEDDDEDEAPKRAKPSKPSGKTGKNECPHGYDFGKDTEDYDECDKCKVWEQCIAKKEQLQRKK